MNDQSRTLDLKTTSQNLVLESTWLLRRKKRSTGEREERKNIAQKVIQRFVARVK
jgi:hypothetical protein